GVGSAGDRPAAGDRPPPGALPPSAVRRDRLRDGWEGPGGEGGSGGAAPPVGAEPPRPECYSPPAGAARRIPGPREPDTRRRALLPPSVGEGRPGRPSHGATALPPPPPLGGPGVGADCPQCAPGVVAPSGPGGFFVVTPPARAGGSRAHGVGGDVGYPP
ncbi:hypothetical protein LEMLEM_LOCUS18506, partial [Lemmus lemmus]